jgi:hypothetical protein
MTPVISSYTLHAAHPLRHYPFGWGKIKTASVFLASRVKNAVMRVG